MINCPILKFIAVQRRKADIGVKQDAATSRIKKKDVFIYCSCGFVQ